MKTFVGFVLAALISVSCASTAEEGNPCERHQTLHADPSFDADERHQLELSTNMWLGFSSGRVALALAYDGGAGPWHVHKVLSTDPVVVAKDATIPWPGVFYGWSTGGEIWLVADRYSVDDMRFLAAHEIGHTIGLRWPGCNDDSDKCVHITTDGNALMSQSAGPSPFNASDLAFCRASCLCP